MLRPLLFRISQDRLLMVLLLVLPLLLWQVPTPMPELLGLVQWQTLVILTGLILLSRGLEDSGYLAMAGRALLGLLHSLRQLALVLVLFSALLSMLITNDVALFIVVPLTLALRALVELPVGRLVIFEALAVNAGSTLSPIGNPQNLFLWQHTGVSFMEFALVMLPLGISLLGLLFIAIPLAFPRRTLSSIALPAVSVPHDRRLFWISLCLYAPFLLAAEAGLAHLILPIMLLWYLWQHRQVVRAMDWSLLALLLLMFVDLGLLARLPIMHQLVHALSELPGGLFSTAVLLSQGISNVPAAVFLANLEQDWRAIAWGVSVGGFGLAIGSLANLIALRMAADRRLWWEFHYWSLPMLVLAWLMGWLLL